MRKLLIFVSICISFYLIQQICTNWQNLFILKKNNLKESAEIRALEFSTHDLLFLEDQPLGDVKDIYKEINKQMRLFSRNHDFKNSLDFKRMNKDGYVKEVEEASAWIGVKQIALILRFYELNSIDEAMLVYGFLDSLEASNFIQVSSIILKENILEANVQIYGRDL